MDRIKEAAVRAKGIAEKKLQVMDFQQARKMAVRAQQLDANVDNISQLIMVCDVHCSSQKKFGNEMDWYGILQVQQSADEATIKKQYRKFALLLHPDKNNFPGAEAAFKLIGEAQRILLDHASRTAHDRKRNASLGMPVSQTMQFSGVSESYHSPHGTNWQSNVGVQSHSQSKFPGFSAPPQTSAQAGFFNGQQTFLTICPFCKIKYRHYRNVINRSIVCPTCTKVFIAYDIDRSGASPAGFTQQEPFGNETKVDIGSKSTSSPGVQKPGSSSKAAKPTVKSRKTNRTVRRQKGNSGESHGLDTKSTSDENESVMCNDSELKGNQVNSGKFSYEQAVRRSTRQRQRVSYKETGSDEDDLNTQKKSRGGGEPLQAENGAWEEVKLKRDSCIGTSFELDPASVPSKLKETILPEEMKLDSGSDDCSDQGDSSGSDDSCDCQHPEPKFCNFDDAKSPSNFKVGQIWALYSDEDSLPKYYGQITELTTQPAFVVQLSWLELESPLRGTKTWRDKKMLVTCGTFSVSSEFTNSYNSSNCFSHCLNASVSWENDGTCNIIPCKGEIWALYRNWNTGIEPSTLRNCNYDLAEVIEDDGSVIKVTMIERLDNFSCVYRPQSQGSSSSILRIPRDEILRFSHQVPAFRLTDEEGGSMRGYWEVDPLAMPERFFAPN